MPSKTKLSVCILYISIKTAGPKNTHSSSSHVLRTSFGISTVAKANRENEWKKSHTEKRTKNKKKIMWKQRKKQQHQLENDTYKVECKQI